MNKCFVIQPFDDSGKYDKRYQDVFAPAIRKADCEPYRVDNDPSVEIPIEDINENIRSSFIVLADITEDNPNVWFELGLAIAYNKKTVLVCSNERKGKKYPFDIQHRSIISYANDSVSDFDSLGKNIEEKIRAYAKERDNLVLPKNQAGILSESIISDEAIIMLGVIADVIDSPQAEIGSWIVKDEYKKLGYSQLACNISIIELEKIEFLNEKTEYYNDEPSVFYKITEKGLNWLLLNKSRFNLSFKEDANLIPKNIGTVQNDFPEDIPF